MKPFKIDKNSRPGGYLQFWGESKPPVVIATKFEQPKIPFKFFKDVEPPSKYIEFVYKD